MFIIVGHAVTVQCRTAIKVLFLYFNLLSTWNVGYLSCSFRSIFILTNLNKIIVYVEFNKGTSGDIVLAR